MVLNGIKKCTEHADDADAPESEEHLAATSVRQREKEKGISGDRHKAQVPELPCRWFGSKSKSLGVWKLMGMGIGQGWLYPLDLFRQIISFDHLV